MVAVIRNAHPHPLSEVPFYCEVPLFNDWVLVMEVRRQIVELRTGLCGIVRVRIRSFEDGEPIGSYRIKEIPDITGFNRPSVDGRGALECFNESTVSTTDYCLLVKTIGESTSRSRKTEGTAGRFFLVGLWSSTTIRTRERVAADVLAEEN